MTDRFWRKVDRSGGPDACWVWLAGRQSAGYGLFYLDGSPKVAHRVAYEITVGPIPDGMQLDHLCRVRACVNPGHLEPVSNRENALRGVGPTAVNAAKTSCVRGHGFTPENTRISPSSGKRTCRTCEWLGRPQRRRMRDAPAAA